MGESIKMQKINLFVGMLSLVDNGSGVGQDRQLFLVLLCRLSDGEECETQYSEDSSITVLEDTLMRFRGFVNLQDKDLREDGLALLDVIKAEVRHSPCLEIIKLEYSLRLKIKRNNWLLADMCPQAANHCTLF